MTTIDLGRWYGQARVRIADLVSDEVGAVAVPATPRWDVHDVVAHLAGVPEDARTGNMAGVTTDPWTAAQVERGRGRTVTELLAAWAADSPMMEAFLSSPAGSSASSAIIDVHTHECDLRSALGLPLMLPDDVLAWADEVLRAGFAGAVDRAGLPAVAVVASPIEVFRSRLGRRTRDEVLALDWSADPEPYLEHWFVFGVADVSLGEVVG
jgi:uncharacterized protein (TIGR03083 family)